MGMLMWKEGQIHRVSPPDKELQEINNCREKEN